MTDLAEITTAIGQRIEEHDGLIVRLNDELERALRNRDRLQAARQALAAGEPFEPVEISAPASVRTRGRMSSGGGADKFVAGDAGPKPGKPNNGQARTSPATIKPAGRSKARDLPAIAKVYLAAVAAKKPAVPALAAHFKVPQSTAQNWPTLLRGAGLIPPAAPRARPRATPPPPPAADSAGIADPPPSEFDTARADVPLRGDRLPVRGVTHPRGQTRDGVTHPRRSPAPANHRRAHDRREVTT